MNPVKLKIIIVEDDIQHCRHLESLLKDNFPEHMVIACYRSGKDAIRHLQKETFDLLFIDIQLSDMNAFELLSGVQTDCFKIVFTTAYNHYAMEAFKAHALAYLLKPIDANALSTAINEVIRQYNSNSEDFYSPSDQTKIISNYLIINEKEKIRFLGIHNITYINANENYSEIHYYDKNEHKKTTTCKTLLYYESLLSAHGFIRVHQSFLINTSEIVEFNKKESSLLLKCGETVPVSRNKKKSLFPLDG